MLKHYYVSPKKRSKSQSSEMSDGSDTATSCIEHHEYLNDFVRATKIISRKAFHSFHEITSSEPNVSIATSHAGFMQATVSASSSGDPNDPEHSSENTTPIQTPQKSYETRLTRMRLAHAFNNAVTYSRSRLAHLPAGASFCAAHIAHGGLGHMDTTTTSGLIPPVRRWNSFHSTRGECHPNKFRRERKSTSPSIVISRRNGDGFRQLSECFVSETQEILATDESEIGSVAAEAASKIDDLIRNDNGDEEIEDVDDIDAIIGVAIPKPKIMDQPPHHTLHSSQTALSANVKRFGGGRPELYQKCNRGSHSSDTSSAYSGSDTMTSVHSSSLDADEVDLSGLVESVVDSDEEDLAESMDSLAVRDTVRECLEKDPTDRTEEDIETLLEFTKNLQAFTNMTLAVRRALCSVMVFAVVEKAGTTVMNDGEELDSWSVLINGHVEVEYSNGETDELQVGDSFGILPTMDKLYHKGVMKTKCDDCQFVCITQTDYYRIQHQGEENTKRHEENGQLVMVTELRHGTMEGSVRRGHVVIRGTPERLMVQLIEENSMTDPTYVEDFLLTHRTFIPCAQNVLRQLLQWFESESTHPAQTTATPIQIRDRVTRVILLWVNNHFTDFETDQMMMKYLEQFENGLENKNMHEQLHLLHIACAAKARTRVVTLARSSRDEDLHFSIIGGYEKGGCGIFISNVDKKTKPEDVGLKRGDQILEVNGNSFEHMKLARALELMTGTTHLCLTVKSNLLAFKEMLQTPDNNSPRPRSSRRTMASSELARLHSQNSQRVRLSSADILTSSSQFDQTDCASVTNIDSSSVHMPFSSNLPPTAAKKDSATSISSSQIVPPSSASKSGSGFMTLGPKRRLQKALIKMNLYPKNAGAALLLDTDDQETQSASSSPISTTSPSNGPATTITTPTPTGSIGSNCSIATSTTSSHTGDSASLANVSATNKTSGSNLYHSQSNPDLTTIYYEDLRVSDYPEHVLKVYKADQSCKYLLVHKETTAHEVVMLALQEFGIHETSSNFSLCEVSVGDGGMIKQRRLPDQLQNLAERIGLAARYYLKTNGITETLVPDDMAPELVRESAVHFLQLNANEVAIQLTVQDFAIFRQIESTEYVDDLFEIPSNYGVPMLKQFSELVNREMFWVVTEVCSEYNMVRRMKIVKQFIKIARHCKECQNFNSMFAILSGLGHAAVSRLRLTWEKLPSKYQKLFNDLQELMDPSRNMSKYRQLVLTELNEQHPIIPFYPVVKKDLTFIHLGNDTYVEALVNFEKLRMIAKEIRSLTHMCSSPYDLLTMLELRGQPPSSAMVALNQMVHNVHNVQNVHPQKVHTHNTHSSGMSALASTLGALAVGASGQATVKRRKKSAAAPNPKKMFEEAQMVRRVKAYLNNIKVITDEDNLHQFSLECEQSGGSAPSSVTIRKRHPSPTLSTTSSTSSTSEGKKVQMAGGVAIITNNDPHDRRPPKFGAASPQAVKKLLSLSEQTKTRPHQPRFTNLMTHVGTGNTANSFGMCANTTASIGLVAADTLRQSSGLPSLYYHHSNSGLPTLSSSPSSTPSPNAHRTQGSVPYSAHNYGFGNQTSNACVNNTGIACLPARAVHERSHSDGTTAPPLPSVDLSMESSSVTSLSNLPLRKHPITGSLTSNDSGHGSYIPSGSGSGAVSDFHSDNFNGSSNNGGGGGLYQVACSIVHNSPNDRFHPQRRHSAISHAYPGHNVGISAPHLLPANASHVKNCTNLIAGTGNGAINSVGVGNRLPQVPPAYNVAAQRALLHRLGRAHSHEGVTSSISISSAPLGFYQPNTEDTDDDGAQVSAV